MTLRATLALLAFAGTAHANAFNINEHDARVTGRGGASVASNTGASSIVFNPGGIAISAGTNIALGGSVYIAEGFYENAGEKTPTDSAPAVVPSMYITSRLAKKFAIGVGFHMPFGLAVSWPENHAQSNVIQDQSLRTYFISPVAGVNLGGGLSIGAGVDIVPATIELESTIMFASTTGTAHLGGRTVGFGGRAGVMYRPPGAHGFKVGVMYRSPVALDFKGDGDFDIAEPFRNELPKDGAITASVTLPQSVAGGVAISPIKSLELEIDATWINWSQTFPNGNLTVDLPDGATTMSPQNYKDTVSYRAGLEYGFANGTAFRAGFIYDPTPIPSSTVSARLPDVDRRSITIGGSGAIGDVGVHVGILYVMPNERKAENNYTYGVEALVLSLGLSGQIGH